MVGTVYDSAEAQAPSWEDKAFAARLLSRAQAETGHDPAVLEKLCLASADPDGALAGVTRVLAARKERFGRAAPRAALGPLVRVCASSRFLQQVLSARPRLVDLLACPRFRNQPGQPRVQRGDDALSFSRKLRRQKQVEILRIALRDLLGTSVFEITRELSRLASVAFEAAVRFHYARLCAAHGPPEGRTAEGPSGFCVLGMGKLGGDELNFSSDVDVLYLYDKDGHTSKGCRISDSMRASPKR